MRHLEKQRPPVRKCYNVAGPSLEICLPIFTSCDNGYDVSTIPKGGGID